MSNSSQEFSFGGSPPRACPGTVGETPQHEGSSPEQLSSDSYEVVDTGPVIQVIEEVRRTPTSSRATSPTGTFPPGGGSVGGESAGSGRGDRGGNQDSRKADSHSSVSVHAMSSKAVETRVSEAAKPHESMICLPSSNSTNVATQRSRSKGSPRAKHEVLEGKGALEAIIARSVSREPSIAAIENWGYRRSSDKSSVILVGSCTACCRKDSIESRFRK